MKTLSICFAAITLFVASPVLAQQSTAIPVQAPVDQLSFDRPESWALKYFTSATLLAGLDTPRTRVPGSFSVGLELAWLPSLNEAQRRVGFDGTKLEDLNKAPVLPRPRVVVGLPARFSLIVAADPPIRAFGIKPKLLALGLERPVYESEGLVVGVRGYGQFGSVEAAFTCPASVLGFAPGSAANSYGCRAVSSDTASLRFVGGEVGVGYDGARWHGLSPHAAFAVNYLDTVFQVNAFTFDYLDRTRLLSHGVTIAASGGLSYPLARKLRASVDVFYTPLWVVRQAGATDRNDGLFNVRGLVAWQFR